PKIIIYIYHSIIILATSCFLVGAGDRLHLLPKGACGATVTRGKRERRVGHGLGVRTRSAKRDPKDKAQFPYPGMARGWMPGCRLDNGTESTAKNTMQKRIEKISAGKGFPNADKLLIFFIA
ncbi:MAG TPA: hypothetical protein VGO47_13340, partial [Chlamydiales bacterium]|nr:hypothetical protein [Chlamydiales bacterium]